MKATVKSPANIAFIKYWGRLDHDIYLPLSTTNSMNLSECYATTTIEFHDSFQQDSVTILDQNDKENEIDLTKGHKNIMLKKTLDRVREKSEVDLNAKIVSKLSFPLGTGIASSAAGLSAFVVAAYEAVDCSSVSQDPQELSREVRLSGSPSAARSVMDGFTELLFGETHETSYVREIADENHWDIYDITVVVNSAEKKISSSQGHEGASSSPFYNARIEYLKGIPEKVRTAILDKDFSTLAKFSQADAINMHGVMMTQDPAAIYFNAGSFEVITKVLELQDQGMEVFFTFDAGANPHLIVTEKDKKALIDIINSLNLVEFYIENKPAKGTQIIDSHLF